MSVEKTQLNDEEESAAIAVTAGLGQELARDEADGLSANDNKHISESMEPNANLISSTSNAFGRLWGKIADPIRYRTPAAIVNNSSRLAFGSRAIADTLSIISGFKYNAPTRTAASAISLAGLGMGMVYNEKPVTEEEKEEIKNMPVLDYAAMRIKQGFDPKNHILATVGLSTIPNGILMSMAGISQSRKGKISAEVYQGGLTILAGLALNMIPDQERAWQISNSVFMYRIPFAFSQANSAYFDGKPAFGWAKSLSAAEKEAHGGYQVSVSAKNERNSLLDHLQPSEVLLDSWGASSKELPSDRQIRDKAIERAKSRLDELHEKLKMPLSAKKRKSLHASAERESARIEQFNLPDYAYNAKVEKTSWLPYKGKHYIGQEWKAIPGDWQQHGKFWFNQNQNVIGFLYGGIKKDKDGNIYRIEKSDESSVSEQNDNPKDIPQPSVHLPVNQRERIAQEPSAGIESA